MAVRKPATIILLTLLLSITVAAQVDVGKGVDFELKDGNTVITAGKNYTFDNVTVYSNALGMNATNLSIDNTATDQANATLWNYTPKVETTSRPSIKLEIDGIGSNSIDISVTGVLPERDYRIDQDSDKHATDSSGDTPPQIGWSHDDWTASHNFTVNLLKAIQNVTVSLTYDLGSEDTYVDDQQRSEGTYTDSDLDYAYLASEAVLNGQDAVFGLVNFGDFIQLSYNEPGDNVQAEMVQGFDPGQRDSVFLIPFTEGTHNVVEGREENVQGGLLSSADFLSFPSPNFAYELVAEKTIQVILDYSTDRIDLNGFDPSLGPGVHEFEIANDGFNINNTLQINVTLD
jgi:hypothetical protein